MLKQVFYTKVVDGKNACMVVYGMNLQNTSAGEGVKVCVLSAFMKFE